MGIKSNINESRVFGHKATIAVSYEQMQHVTHEQYKLELVDQKSQLHFLQEIQITCSLYFLDFIILYIGTNIFNPSRKIIFDVVHSMYSQLYSSLGRLYNWSTDECIS